MDDKGKGGEDALFQRSMKIVSVVALYWYGFVSISMVFLNKHLLSDVDLKAPMFVTWFQCVVAVVASYFLGMFRDAASFMNMFPTFEYDIAKAKEILPLSAVFVGMIAFNNLCLKEVGVPFYNVGRSLTTLFNIVLSYVMLHQSTSVRALGMCAIIVMGFFLGVDQEGDEGELSMIGVFYGIMASLCVALNAIYIKKVLPVVNGDSWLLMAYNNANATLLFLPVILLFQEVPQIVASPDIFRPSYWVLMSIAGFFGIAIGLVTMLQVSVTSPVTHNISGTAKACAQTILALQINGEVRSAMWWLGNLFVLGGSLGYAIVKRAEMRREIARESSQEDSKA
ncbi:GDP-fucose transporter 1 [Salpingoeca rosetta]|uniref:GDP-fucose transporter 1 n=1 Tax=Salpingoeca rosetta (strain ATCC 50818 / BSB-021) TaxID=946362 RepID=F2U244_SALR5|nr:GDP-fucose transporter 1 [Salpingoeca rosetta]EGD81696.1 GDP-fucose transporter 1 [Salpingoeca rosetta]|eukprot:XP_004996900.1 GDP-fucose transporter 1 [Salpingoeca rosetta]